jgi:hypothetical protein
MSGEIGRQAQEEDRRWLDQGAGDEMKQDSLLEQGTNRAWQRYRNNDEAVLTMDKGQTWKHKMKTGNRSVSQQ